MCAYRDVSGLFTTEMTEISEKPAEKIPKTPTDGAQFHLDKTSVKISICSMSADRQVTL